MDGKGVVVNRFKLGSLSTKGSDRLELSKLRLAGALIELRLAGALIELRSVCALELQLLGGPELRLTGALRILHLKSSCLSLSRTLVSLRINFFLLSLLQAQCRTSSPMSRILRTVLLAC